MTRAAYMRDWRAKNLARAKEIQRESHARHRQERLEAMRAWKLANPERKKALDASLYQSKKEKLKAGMRAYYLRNKNRFLQYGAQRRARRAGAGGAHTLAEWEQKCAQFDHRCAYCGARSKLTRDHDVPLSRGGTNEIGNIIPACLSCNQFKHTSTADEFRAKRSRIA